MIEHFKSSRLLRRVDGKMAEILPDGSVKREDARQAPEPTPKKVQVPTPSPEKNKMPKYRASSASVVRAELDDTATAFRKSGKERIQVKNEGRPARDMGGPHILEPKRALSSKEKIRETIQANKSERNTSRGRVPKQQFNRDSGALEPSGERARGRTTHKPSWKLNRLHQRRGLDQGRWER